MKDFHYYEGRLVVTSSWILSHLMTKSAYDYHVRRGNLVRLRTGGGLDRPALIDYERIRPEKYKRRIVEILGVDPYRIARKSKFEELIVPDPEARRFFAEALKWDKDIDRKLPVLVNSAEILNAVLRMYEIRRGKRRKLGGRTYDLWKGLSAEVNALDRRVYPHRLPRSKDRLRKKAREYRKEGYGVLLHGNRGNGHRRKRNEKLDYLIVSIAAMPTKPYDFVVHRLYERFLRGELQVVDRKTGELFDPADPDYKPVSVGTVWNIISENRALISALRDGQYHYNLTHRPHHHRHKPRYSLSKISLDDRDIMHTKLPNGKHVFAYYVFDTLSGAIIGKAYGKRKDSALFIEAIRDMYRFLHRNGLGIPMEAEVEHHLVRNFKDTLMTVFPLTRWANPANPREKYAETGIRLKKYGPEKERHPNVGRHYARNAKNVVTTQKIYDESNDKFKDAKAEFEDIVAMDLEDIRAYNMSAHPDFPGQTRMEVLKGHVNPDLPEIPAHVIAMYAGSVYRHLSLYKHQYLKLMRRKWVLSDIGILDRLKGRGLVDAYWIPDEEGEADRLYLFQDGVYVGDAVPVATYNVARAEWTETDAENYRRQAMYVSQWDSRIKEGKEKAARVEILANDDAFDAEAEEVHVSVPESGEAHEGDDFEGDYMQTEEWKRRAEQDI